MNLCAKIYNSIIISLLFMDAAPAQYLDSVVDEKALAQLCRTVFPPTNMTPDNDGGWSIVQSEKSANILCLSGTLAKFDKRTLLGASKKISLDYIVVRSAGGPSAQWLELAEVVESHSITLVIDDLCLSACAIYLPPVAENVVSVPGSILAWHGGPSPHIPTIMAGAHVEIGSIIALSDLEDRTAELYLRHGISTHVLVDSSLETNKKILQELFNELKIEGARNITIIGYAYSPDTLRTCFGFSNISFLWHAGDDIAVAKQVNLRNPNLIALESPKNKNYSKKCRR